MFCSENRQQKIRFLLILLLLLLFAHLVSLLFLYANQYLSFCIIASLVRSFVRLLCFWCTKNDSHLHFYCLGAYTFFFLAIPSLRFYHNMQWETSRVLCFLFAYFPPLDSHRPFFSFNNERLRVSTFMQMPQNNYLSNEINIYCIRKATTTTAEKRYFWNGVGKSAGVKHQALFTVW